MKKKKTATHAILLMLILTLLTSCAQETVQSNESPIADESKSYQARIEELEAELFGSAATDFVRAAEIDKRRAEIDEELLSLYELVM